MKLEISVDEANALFWALDAYINEETFVAAVEESHIETHLELITNVYDRISDIYIEDCKRERAEFNQLIRSEL